MGPMAAPRGWALVTLEPRPSAPGELGSQPLTKPPSKALGAPPPTSAPESTSGSETEGAAGPVAWPGRGYLVTQLTAARGPRSLDSSYRLRPGKERQGPGRPNRAPRGHKDDTDGQHLSQTL